MSPATGLFIVLLLVAANGFFVATEFALVSSRSTRIDQLAAAGNRAARIVQRAKGNPTRFISGTQLGVTVASLLLGWIGENTFAELIQPLLDAIVGLIGQQPMAAPGEISTPAHAIASVLALAMITFFHITCSNRSSPCCTCLPTWSCERSASSTTARSTRSIRPKSCSC